jgi:N-acetylmuramoyl-L-alanine amidase
VRIAFFLLSAFLAAGPLRAETPAPIKQSLAGRVILLDPGHAVMDEAGHIVNPGARARRGAWERDVALNVAEKVAPLLEARGAKVFMTRTRDNPWRYGHQKAGDNRSRAIFANLLDADAYVRIHCDWNRDRRFKGFTTFYYRWGSRRLAQFIREAMALALPGHHDHGLHRRSFVSVTAKMPAVLVELGVLSHKAEGEELGTEAYQTRLSQALAEGLVNYFEHVLVS